MERQKLEKILKENLTAAGLKTPRHAIVIPIVYDAEDPYLLIEVRSEGIFQAGDPCFPGGRIEPGETPDEAAAREMEEEIGIHVPAQRFLGQLPTVQTRLGSQANVYVCMVSEDEAAQTVINPSEVAVLLRVPMSVFLQDPQAYNYIVEGHNIWGMTAGAIRHLCAVWKTTDIY